jgi:putative tryptophan/tyrosine transport system substrate-binding protein
MIGRRQFITLLGAAATWPLVASAQQGERTRRIGVLLSTSEGDPGRRAQLAAFVQRLTELGWAEGRNARLDVRWTAGSVDAARKHAAELVALAPDVIVTDTSFDVAAVQQATRRVPIVFGGVIDPVGNGLVNSLARPGGNTTGFTAFEYAIGAKWLELLKEVAPHITRAVVLRDPTIAVGIGQFAAIQATAPFGIELSAAGLHDAGGIEPAVAAFARGANGGLVMTAGPFGANHPDVIPTLAALQAARGLPLALFR